MSRNETKPAPKIYMSNRFSCCAKKKKTRKCAGWTQNAEHQSDWYYHNILDINIFECGKSFLASDGDAMLFAAIDSPNAVWTTANQKEHDKEIWKKKINDFASASGFQNLHLFITGLLNWSCSFVGSIKDACLLGRWSNFDQRTHNAKTFSLCHEIKSIYE